MEAILKREDIKLVLNDALKGEQNRNILNLTNARIVEYKTSILQELHFDDEKQESLLDKLEEYRYIDDINDFKIGSYIRWLGLKNATTTSDIVFARGGFINDIVIHGGDVHIKCKSFMGKHMQLLGAENIIFQKMSDQEKVILSVLDYLHTSHK